MAEILTENLLQLLIVCPLLLFSLKSRNKESMKILLVFAVYFLFRSALLHLPLEMSQAKFINGNWNWSGKIFAILSSCLFLLVYRKYSLKDYFLTLKQNKDFLKKGISIVGVLFIIGSLMSYIFSTPKEWSWETFFFQLTMPGIDEEIAYRGIMLGLLTKALKLKIKMLKFSIGNPAILITAILFGFAHSLFITNFFEIEFNIYPFLRTGIIGWIWGWLTLKSGSILLALISHNLGNVTDHLIRTR